MGFGITAPESEIIRDEMDQAVPFLWDQGPKFVMLLESRISNFGTKLGSAIVKHTSLRV